PGASPASPASLDAHELRARISPRGARTGRIEPGYRRRGPKSKFERERRAPPQRDGLVGLVALFGLGSALDEVENRARDEEADADAERDVAHPPEIARAIEVVVAVGRVRRDAIAEARAERSRREAVGDPRVDPLAARRAVMRERHERDRRHRRHADLDL